MRLLVIGLLAFGAFSASFGATRIIHIKLTKPNVTYAEFAKDRDACIEAATTRGWTTVDPPGRAMFHSGTNVYVFARCMDAKGYSYDANGFDTGRAWAVHV